MKNNFFKSYKFRFLFFILLFMVITCSSLIYFSVEDTTRTAIDTYSEKGIAILNQATNQIDRVKMKKLCSALDREDPYYEELYKVFNSILASADCKFLYAMKQVYGNNFAYIVDGTDRSDTINFSEIGTIEDISSHGRDPFICMSENRIVYSTFRKQEGWGWMFTLYAPLLDSNDGVLGFVAVDYNVDSLIKQLSNVKLKLIMVGGIITAVGLLFMLILILAFFKSFNSVVDAMNNISEGAKNLSVRLHVPGSNELRRLSTSCNDVLGSLQNTMQTVSMSVNNVNTNSTKILEQTRQLMDLIYDVNSNMDDVQSKASSQTNLISTLEGNTGDLKEAIDILNRQVTEQEITVNESIAAIKSIVETVVGTDGQVKVISEEYESIVEETKANEIKQNNMTEKVRFIQEQAQNLNTANTVITSIAQKTNLLAMNAAIEASHAGEAGKGFSVVASEIRALAENSSKQTQNISNLVNDIDEAVKQVVEASDESEKAFSELGTKIGKLADSMNKIKVNMSEQNENAENITSMLELLTNSTNSISSAYDRIKEKTGNVVKGIGTMKFSIKRINETSDKTKTLLNEMSDFANDTNESSENNKKVVDSINEIVNSYKF